MKNILDFLRCPHCGTSLVRPDDSRTLRCPAGHAFDLAKSGYVNLLPPGKEKNARSGDEREMVKAREEFLALGLYAGITDTLASVAAESAADAPCHTVCDMGCGEGWHTRRFTKRFAELTAAPVLTAGFDASKYAAERACKCAVREGLMPASGIGAAHDAPASAYFMPGNIFRLPLADHSVTLALSMFAPVAAGEAARILTPDGLLIVVSSGKEHLLELRQKIYDDVRLSDELPPVPDGFTEVVRKNHRYTADVPTRDALAALFTMTPFYYKTTEAGRERLLSSDLPFSVTVDVNYAVFRVK